MPVPSMTPSPTMPSGICTFCTAYKEKDGRPNSDRLRRISDDGGDDGDAPKKKENLRGNALRDILRPLLPAQGLRD